MKRSERRISFVLVVLWGLLLVSGTAAESVERPCGCELVPLAPGALSAGHQAQGRLESLPPVHPAPAAREQDVRLLWERSLEEERNFGGGSAERNTARDMDRRPHGRSAIGPHQVGIPVNGPLFLMHGALLC